MTTGEDFKNPSPNSERSAVDESGMTPGMQAAMNRTSDDITKNVTGQGTFGEKRLEAIPNFIQTESEKVIASQNNSWIVLGRDRPGNIGSGKGGKGDTQAASIDLVVGRMGYKPDSRAYVDPDFNTDSARIYISQKTDIDENFNITEGTIGKIKTKSGIGIKADGVRVIGREGIKLVTTTDKFNSHGKKAESLGNIDFIAGNNTDQLEPLVKGKRLVDALEVLARQLSDVTKTLNGFLSYQMEFNKSITSHTHKAVCGPYSGIAFSSGDLVMPAAKSALNMGSKTAVSNVVGATNKQGWAYNALNESGDHYILSRNVNTT